MSDFELYRSQWRVTAWKDGAVYQTELVTTSWFPVDQVENNKPAETGVTYSPPVEANTQAELRGIRKAKR